VVTSTSQRTTETYQSCLGLVEHWAQRGGHINKPAHYWNLSVSSRSLLSTEHSVVVTSTSQCTTETYQSRLGLVEHWAQRGGHINKPVHYWNISVSSRSLLSTEHSVVVTSTSQCTTETYQSRLGLCWALSTAWWSHQQASALLKPISLVSVSGKVWSHLGLKARSFSLGHQPFDSNCSHMCTAVKHPVPDRVKPSFVIFWHPGTLTLSPEHQSAQMSKITNDNGKNGTWLPIL